LASLRWLSILPIACLFLAGCNKFQHKKPDPTKGVVTGIVLCSDTGKPARFATVILTAAPKKGEKSDDADPLPAAETTVTDLDGRFRLEAVQPGHYYAFATLEGYLDPEFAMDPTSSNPSPPAGSSATTPSSSGRIISPKSPWACTASPRSHSNRARRGDRRNGDIR